MEKSVVLSWQLKLSFVKYIAQRKQNWWVCNPDMVSRPISEHCKKLVHSMPKCVEEVIKGKETVFFSLFYSYRYN